ncbi:MurR/RpiR family transcriptional regulator [Paenibacillaceae bacterium WGS1546]|uniref:MurR/RpiR family transcriptional regulator n=1 Tax=Cohnella sp. WGS1546 TaxID=3366810 RepID=UPI00372D6512
MTNIEIRVRNIYNELSNSEKKAADYFLADVERIFQQPIAQLAESAGVSQVAWVRLAKTLGFDGLKSMKRSLFSELNSSSSEDEDKSRYIFTDIKDYSGLSDVFMAIRNSSMQSIEDTVNLLNADVVDAVVQRLIEARSVKLFGVGASALVAEDFYNKLLRIGSNVCFSHDGHIQLTYAANTREGDVCFFISHSGMTKEVNEAFDIASKTKGATMVSLTKLGKNPLAAKSDFELYTSSPENNHRSGAMSSRISQLIVIDVLFTALASRNYDQVIDSLVLSSESCRTYRKI